MAVGELAERGFFLGIALAHQFIHDLGRLSLGDRGGICQLFVVRCAQVISRLDSGLDRLVVDRAFQQMRVDRHDRRLAVLARVLEVTQVPQVRVASTLASQIGTDAAGAPLERMVVDKLAGLRVLPVTLGFGIQAADHLRVTVVAALGHVDIASEQFQRCVGSDRSDGGDVRADQEYWNHLEQRGGHDGHGDPDGEADRQPFPAAMPMGLAPDIHLLGNVQDALLQLGLGSRAIVVVARQTRGLIDRHDVGLGSGCPGHVVIDAHQHDAAHIKHTREQARPPHGDGDLDRLHKVAVHQIARIIEGSPHQALSQARDVDRYDVQQDRNGAQPEMPSRHLYRPQLGLEDARQ